MSSSVPRVLVCSKFSGLRVALEKVLPAVKFQEVEPENISREEETSAWKKEVLVADPDLIMPLFKRSRENVAFIQSTWAGVNAVTTYLLAHPKEPKPEVTLCRLTHPTFSQFMAEYLVAQVINAERNFYKIRDCQRDKDWQTGDTVGHGYRSLNELTVGILGVGQIGRITAQLFKAFGSRVVGLVRTVPPSSPCPHVDAYYAFSDLCKLLAECDYVCSILPQTKETTDILSGSVLEACKDRKPILLNIGRGNVISDDSLVSALDSDWIGGAVLDVFNEEPLSKDSPLWSHPKVVVTPHVAAISRPKEIAACFKDNFERYQAGKELLNVVDWNNSY